MSVLKQLLVFLIFTWICTSCNSSLSTTKVEDIEQIGATIEIAQKPTDGNDSWAFINLFDKDGKPVRNDSIKLIVNGVEIALQHRQGLYYTDESKYYSESPPINQVHTFEVKLTDGKKYFLGTINALAEEKIENIECDEQGDFNKNTLIKWKDLKNMNRLEIHTSVLLKTSNKNEENYSHNEPIIKQISRNGAYTIPKTDYFDPKWTVSAFELKFMATRFGKMNPKLVKGSKISISTVIEKYIRLDPT